MATTRYFIEQVLRKRPYLTEDMCRAVVGDPISSVKQDNGRVRYWGYIVLPDDQKKRILRVVTLEDGETIHNAFIDRNFREDGS